MNSNLVTPTNLEASGTSTIELSSERVASGLSQPLYVTAPTGDRNRLFIIEQKSGAIKILNLGTGTVSSTPFLTIPASELLNNGFEQGLLGLAFHPNYATNGKFYVNYTSPSGGVSGRQTKLVEYQVSADNPNLADPTTARTILTVDQPQENHNGGWIAFGPDGYLYWSKGDGGGSGFQPGIPSESDNSQDITDNLLGKILRLDINSDAFPSDARRNYAIPADNPFVGQVGDDEIWVYGLRNPWRPSFDRLTGDLYIADVGQGRREEINFQPNSSKGGENYGWNLREGTLDYKPGTIPPNLVAPIYEYDHSIGQSVTGGYVYRGSVSELGGTYFFGDFSSGRIWSFRYNNGAIGEFTERTAQLAPNLGSIDGIASFGEDAAGNLYIVDLDGEIFRLAVKSSNPAPEPKPRIVGGDGNDNLVGGASDEILDGRGGSDQLRSGGGDDELIGGTGSDYLEGGSGSDTLRGGSDNDTYLIDSLNDLVVENPNEGTDSIRSPFTYTLAPNVERLQLLGTAAIDGTGNSLNNTLKGNSANNIIRGEAGNDNLLGASGDDTLVGGLGSDTLTGGVGSDRFAIDTGAAYNTATIGIDYLIDFVPGADKIVLDRTTFTALSSLSFASVASVALAQTSSALITYIQSTGSLFYNQNGTVAGFGTGSQFADLTNGLSIAPSDFLLQA